MISRCSHIARVTLPAHCSDEPAPHLRQPARRFDEHGAAAHRARHRPRHRALRGHARPAALQPRRRRRRPAAPRSPSCAPPSAAPTALLVCTPEYAGALPGAFKNLLEWLVGGGEAYRKPIAWINVSGPAAPTGGADAHDSLRKVVGYLSMEIVEEACVRIPVARDAIGEDGLIADPAIREPLAAALAALREGAARVESF